MLAYPKRNTLPSPQMWNTRDQLVADLQAFDWRKEVEHTRKFASEEWELVIRRAVASNTFRAFHRMPERPSEVFRDWAFGAFVSRGFLQTLCTIQGASDYDTWLTKLVEDFRSCWRSRMAVEVPYGPAYKLPNLLLKCVALRPEITALQQQRLVNWLHIPLDSYTIQALRGWFRLPSGSGIPSGATMKFVRDAKLYDSIQGEIKDIAKLADVPPIAFDYLAWNAGHRKRST
jgi:hypothetical protein